MIAFHEALKFQTTVGRAAIEARARELDAQLIDGLAKLPGRHGVDLAGAELRARSRLVRAGHARRQQARRRALHERQGRGNDARRQGSAGLRVSPHFYNSPAEVDRLLAGLAKYLKSGV